MAPVYGETLVDAAPDQQRLRDKASEKPLSLREYIPSNSCLTAAGSARLMSRKKQVENSFTTIAVAAVYTLNECSLRGPNREPSRH